MAPPDWKPIKLSARLFGHVSQGMYRTPAGAIKELISNAFDADSPFVKIHTGFPHFATFTCEDRGQGIEPAEFIRLVEEHGIGTSFKRMTGTQETAHYHRPIIGRLGIGILSLAQICTQFTITSHHPVTRTAFRATIDFPPYTKQEIDKATQRTTDGDRFIEGGKYMLDSISFDSEHSGVMIFTNLLRESFRKRMRDLRLYGNKLVFGSTAPYSTFARFLNAIYGTKEPTPALSGRSDYDQLLFGLALSAPLPYFEEERGNVALGLPALRDYQARVKSYSFAVEVDNMTLARPVYLPSDREKHTATQCLIQAPESASFTLRDGTITEILSVRRSPVAVSDSDVTFNLYELDYRHPRVAGRRLHFTGYLFQQAGRIYPRDIHGVLIRIKDVAIGGYDPGIMTYPLAEGPRYSMVTLELFVLDGFEDALNIDRDSFNGLDPHYLRMQAYVHGILHDVIFPETWQEEKLRNRRRRESRATRSEKTYLRGLSALTQESYESVKRVESDSQARVRPSKDPVIFRPRSREIEVDRSHPEVRKLLSRRRHAPFAEKIVIAFERALQESTDTKRRQTFYRLLAALFESL